MIYDIAQYELIANGLNIKFNRNHWCEEENMHLMDVVNSWYSLLRLAFQNGIAWGVGDYQPILLYAIVDEKLNKYGGK